MRDITLEDTVYFNFTTRSFSTGVPTVLAGTPALSVLESNNATPITAGVSVSVDRASVVGLNQATVVATAANGYESGKSYAVYISTGTVGGVSVVGEVVAQFTIQASAAAVDLANGTDGLGAIKAETAAILTDTAEIGAAGAGLTNINLPNQTMDITGNITGNLSGSVGSVTGNVGGNVAGSVASVTADVTLSAAEENSIADALLARNVAGGSSTGRLVKEALYVLRNKTDIAAGTLTVYGVDDTTAAFTAAVSTTAGDPISQIDPA